MDGRREGGSLAHQKESQGSSCFRSCVRASDPCKSDAAHHPHAARCRLRTAGCSSDPTPPPTRPPPTCKSPTRLPVISRHHSPHTHPSTHHRQNSGRCLVLVLTLELGALAQARSWTWTGTWTWADSRLAPPTPASCCQSALNLNPNLPGTSASSAVAGQSRPALPMAAHGRTSRLGLTCTSYASSQHLSKPSLPTPDSNCASSAQIDFFRVPA